MSKIICYCNTYYQMIVALQINNTLKKEDEVSIIFSDHSNNAEEIVNVLRRKKVFKDVFFLHSKGWVNKSKGIFENLKDVWDAVVGNESLFKGLNINDIYDEIIYFNQDITVGLLYAFLYVKNSNIVCSRFEEGVMSYCKIDKSTTKIKEYPARVKLVSILRKMCGRKVFQETEEFFYCFYPEIYRGKLKTVPIPKLSDQYVKAMMKDIFLEEHTLEYREKYIFFASICDIEGGEPIGEFDLIKKIADIVGKENLLIKLHPRETNVEKYLKEGLHIDNNSAIPWEAIQLNWDFSEHIFLTAISGSVLSVNAINDKAVTTYFLYPLCNIENNFVAKTNVEMLEQILVCMKKDLKNVEIVDDVEDCIVQ